MKKGFTLIELIGVLVILGVLVAFTFPMVIDIVNDKKQKTEGYEVQMIQNAAKLYIKDNKLEGQATCIDISDLQSGKYLKSVNTTKTKVVVRYTGGTASYTLANSCS